MSTSAFAAPSCRGLFLSEISQTEFEVRAYQSRIIYHKTISPNGSNEKTGYSHARSGYDDGYTGFLYSPADMDEAYVASVIHSGISQIHHNYGERLTDQEKKIIIRSDWQNFISYLKEELVGYVAVIAHRSTVAFLRVFDGRKELTPCEKILKEKKITTSFFDNLRSQNFEIFELGKYLLNPDLDAPDRTIARAELFKWLIKNYLSSDEETMRKRKFIIDVGSVAHAKLYERGFGAKIIPAENFEPALSKIDYVLTVDAYTLKQKLLSIIGDN